MLDWGLSAPQAGRVRWFLHVWAGLGWICLPKDFRFPGASHTQSRKLHCGLIAAGSNPASGQRETHPLCPLCHEDKLWLKLESQNVGGKKNPPRIHSSNLLGWILLLEGSLLEHVEGLFHATMPEDKGLKAQKWTVSTESVGNESSSWLATLC